MGDRALRVLMLTDYFPKPTLESMGVWALEQARGLKAAGAEVRVVSPTSWIPPLLRKNPSARRFHDCPLVYDWDGLRVRYPRWPLYGFARARRLWYGRPRAYCRFAARFLRSTIDEEIRDWKPDVVFAHHSVPNGLTALWIKKQYGIPFVVQDHDFGSIESCNSMPGRRAAFAEVARGAAIMTSVSQRMCKAVQKLFPGTRTSPLYNGTRRLPAGVLQTPRPAEIVGRTVVFCAAIMYERKGVPLLVRAFAQVARDHPNLVLRLAGDGVEREAVGAAIVEADLGDRIQRLGLLPHERIVQEMAWCDLFMLVGWAEPFATVYLEAMSAGKPIICCNDGGICDVLQDGIQGLAVTPKDLEAAASALKRLVDDEPLRRRMGKAAGELFERQLTLDSAARSVLKILHEAAMRGI